VVEESDDEQPPDMVWAALDSAINYISSQYGEQAFPAPEIEWSAEDITPEGLVGATTYLFTAGDLTANVAYALVAPDATVFNISVDDTVTGFHWLGNVDTSGQVNEQYAPLFDAEGEYCIDKSTGARLGYTEAVAIAEGSECGQQGQLKQTRICNQDTGTWWIDLDMDMPGCNPACVVDLNSGTAEINGRCMGVLPPDEIEGEPPALVPTPSESGQEIEQPVVAWYGYVTSTPAGSQFDDYLVVLPEGTAEVGITGADAAIENEIVAMRDMVEGPGKYAHFWGTLACPMIDYGGCELVVNRIRAEGPGAFFDPDPVEGWEGTIFSGPPGPRSGGDDAFVLLGDVNIWYGIWSPDTDINNHLESLRDTGTVIRVWGEVIAGIPDWNGTQIQVSRFEEVDNPSAAVPPAPDWPDADDGMVAYLNEDYGYHLRVPPTATIAESGAVGFASEELPEGMTAEEYMTKLQEQYGNQLCVRIEVGLGYIDISAPPNEAYRYIPCGLTGLGAGETVKKSEQITIEEQTYTAQGFEWIGNMAPCSPPRETLDCHFEVMTFKLEDGTRIEFGSRHESTASFEDYLMKGKPMLQQILASYETMPARLSGYSYEGWQTYTSDKFGYSVKYPGDAAIMGADLDETVQFVGSGHWPILTVEHVDSPFFHPPTGTDVSQWVLDLHTDYDGIGPEMTIAGLPAVHLVYKPGPGWEASDEYFFIRDEQLFRILILHSDGQQDWNLYNQFLHSFTFDDQN